MKKNNHSLDPLAELQKEFCLFIFDSQIRVGICEEIRKAKKGNLTGNINMYKIQDSNILMQRYLEKIPVSVNVKDCIKNFLVNPNTIIYDNIAFTPQKTPKSTLNYWVEPYISSSNEKFPLLTSFL